MNKKTVFLSYLVGFVIIGSIQKLAYIELVSKNGNKYATLPYLHIPLFFSTIVYGVANIVAWKYDTNFQRPEITPFQIDRHSVLSIIGCGIFTTVANMLIVYSLEPSKLVPMLQMFINLVCPIMPFIETYSNADTTYAKKMYLPCTFLLLILCIFLTSINFWTLDISLIDALFSGLYIIAIVLLGCSTIIQQKYFKLKKFYVYDKTNFMFWYTLLQFCLTLIMFWMEFVVGYYTKIKFIENNDSSGINNVDDPTFYNIIFGDFFSHDGYDIFGCAMLVVSTIFFNVCWLQLNIESATFTMFAYAMLYPFAYFISGTVIAGLHPFSLLYFGIPVVIAYGLYLRIYKVWERTISTSYITLDDQEYADNIIFYS